MGRKWTKGTNSNQPQLQLGTVDYDGNKAILMPCPVKTATKTAHKDDTRLQAAHAAPSNVSLGQRYCPPTALDQNLLVNAGFKRVLKRALATLAPITPLPPPTHKHRHSV